MLECLYAASYPTCVRLKTSEDFLASATFNDSGTLVLFHNKYLYSFNIYS